MTTEQQEFLDWMSYTFDISYTVKDDWVYITTDTKAVFSINTTDCQRFGKYTLFHKPLGREGAHVQVKSDSFSYCLWVAGAHDLHKYVIKSKWSKEDFRRWREDFWFLKRSNLLNYAVIA